MSLVQLKKLANPATNNIMSTPGATKKPSNPATSHITNALGAAGKTYQTPAKHHIKRFCV
jgi:hypothetical protein